MLYYKRTLLIMQLCKRISFLVRKCKLIFSLNSVAADNIIIDFFKITFLIIYFNIQKIKFFILEKINLNKIHNDQNIHNTIFIYIPVANMFYISLL